MGVRFKTLIVDDELLARERIRQMLANDPEVEIVGECSNGQDAIEMIRQMRPDLLFLDIQMPRMDGFGVLKRIDPRYMPSVVFVTAYDQYAVKAFEVHAVDYVLKPFKRKRFQDALARVKSQMEEGRGHVTEGMLALLRRLTESPVYLQRLTVRTEGKILLLRANEIDWLQAEDNYVRVHQGANSYLIRDSLNRLEEQLDPERFSRIHRSAIVNIDVIRELQPWFNKTFRVVLRNGTIVPMSRRYKKKFSKLLGEH